MRAGVFALVVALSGCIDDHLVHCPSPKGELACAVGSVCVASGCASADEAKACATAADNDACKVNDVDGRCIGGACRTPICGNGVTEGDEQCDDGNLTSGDGCAGNCASNETCGNGVIDFITHEECDDGNLEDGDACRRDCTVPRCGDGIVDSQNGENCDDGSANSDASGAACRTNCQPARCGDNVLDPGEVCEDGNVVAGDGCSSDCRSNETCGNGVIDGVRDEQCDDGNRPLSHDGCTASCTIESPDWRQLPLAPPSARYSYGATYDSTRKRIVIFGGTGNLPTDETWELVRSTWVRVDVVNAPSARVQPSMAYDPVRHRVVLFGGFGTVNGGPSSLADTWEYDGINWTKITTATVPGARSGASMVFDPSRGAVVMFGGGAPLTNEVWTYDGTDWTLVATTNPPSARNASAIAYDSGASRIVIFGGVDEAFARKADTYQLVGTTWTPLDDGPSGLDGSLAYDAARDRVVLVASVPGSPSVTNTYELAGSTWSNTTPAFSNLTARGGISIQYVPGCTCVVAFGGQSSAGTRSDTWTYNGLTWTSLTLQQTPRAATNTAIAYDAHRGKVVLYSGADPVTGLVDETWELSRGYWTPTDAVGAGARAFHAMAYDASRELVVMFGGSDAGATEMADTWEYNGQSWTQASPTASPPGTYGHALAYDAKRKRIVMFGGSVSNVPVADTYEYNGATWTKMTPSAAPSPRTSAQMTYDPVRQRVVLFGGFNGSQVLADTWEYDGTTWFPISTAMSPSARRSGIMAFDAARGRTILFGGLASSSFLDDTWEYDGLSWKPVTPSITPQPRGYSSGVYDPVAGQTILFGGLQDAGNGLADTWALSWSSSAFPAERCRRATVDEDTDGATGCADPDCWARCTPECPPRTTCDLALPRCGDGVCAPVEDYLICPTDCTAP